MNYEAMNGYVLAAIVFFGLIFYGAVIWVGWSDIKARTSKRGAARKRASGRGDARRWRKLKRSA